MLPLHDFKQGIPTWHKATSSQVSWPVIAVSQGKPRQLWGEIFWGNGINLAGGRALRPPRGHLSKGPPRTALYQTTMHWIHCAEMNWCTLVHTALPGSRLHSIQGSSVQGTARDLQSTILPPIHRKSTFLPEQPVLLHKICSKIFWCNQICKTSLLCNPM